MADEDVADLRMVEKRVIDGQHRAARITEHDFDAEVDQAFNQNVRAALFGHDEILPLDAGCALCPGSGEMARRVPLIDIKWLVNS
jgi:hypothetical protein